jgi:glycosyltransferase involved in cell wall biosynthesis
MSSVCLCMVVKNESALIRTALRSVKGLIDRWSITDTGSCDGTQIIIQQEMVGIPGQLHECPWVNWAVNRTQAIELAKASGADFIFLLDADEQLIMAIAPKELDSDCAYWVTIKYGSIFYQRPNLLSVKHNWHYIGVTHEYLTPFPDTPKEVRLNLTLRTHPTRATKTSDKCAADAILLEEALKTEPGNSRYVFYLAQSYRDSGEQFKALEMYQARTVMGGWYEEVWYSFFQIAELMVALNYPEIDVTEAYVHAHAYNPKRPESLGTLVRYLRLRRKYHLAYTFADIAKLIPQTQEKLFVEPSYADWRNLDEYSIVAYWTGRYHESLSACNDLLASGRLPAGEIERVKKNRQFAVDKVGEHAK